MLTTTLSELYKHHACQTGWYTLTGFAISDFKESLDRIVTLQEILDSNGLMDAVWAWRAVKGLPLSAIHYITFSSLHDDKTRRFPLLAGHIETIITKQVTADINSKVYRNYIWLTLDPLMTEVASLLGMEHVAREQALQMSIERLNTKVEISEKKHLDFLQQYANLAWWERIWFAIVGLPDNFE